MINRRQELFRGIMQNEIKNKKNDDISYSGQSDAFK